MTEIVTDRRRAAGAATRRRIEAVAETLFANAGYDAVGLRDIIRKAEANSAAVHYHFGTKSALFRHILRQRAEPIAQGRMTLLAELRARGPLQLRAVIEAFLRPAFAEAQGGPPGRSSYARLRLMARDDSIVRAVLADVFDESSNAYLAAFRACLPELPEAALLFRFHFLLGTMFYAMANPGRIRDLGGDATDPFDLDQVLDHLVPFIEAGFQAPPPHEENRR